MAPASVARAAAVPNAAGRQPRKVATARTIVKASTTSTIEAKNAALTAGAAMDQLSIEIPFSGKYRNSDSTAQIWLADVNVPNALISRHRASTEWVRVA